MKVYYLIILILLFFIGGNAFSQSIVKQNLGENVNSQYNDLIPIISPDGSILYFYRTGDPLNFGGKNDGDIWYSELDSNGNWTPSKNIGYPLNNAYSSWVTSVTPDGNTMLLGGEYDIDGKRQSGCFLTYKTSEGWTYPEKVEIKDFYNNTNQVNYCLTADGKAILISCERDDSYGFQDLHVSFLQEDGTWSEPLNLGETVNTHLGEYAPFMAPDGKTMYFSSNGHPGHGGADLFITRRLDDTWLNWMEPKNLGPEINTPANDFYFKIPATGDFAYYASITDPNNKLDIMRFKLKEELKPKPAVLIYGKVYDSETKQPIEAKISYETLPNGKETGIARTDPATGNYKIVLAAGDFYGFNATAKNYVPSNEYIDLMETNEYVEIERDFALLPITKKGKAVRLNNLFFDYNKCTLRKASFPELNRMVTFLKEHPKIKFEIAGHTDDIGSDNYNQKLSQKRADAVVKYLVDKGIDPTRIRSVGYGETKPIADNTTEEGRQKNRRVEFIIL